VGEIRILVWLRIKIHTTFSVAVVKYASLVIWFWRSWIQTMSADFSTFLTRPISLLKISLVVPSYCIRILSCSKWYVIVSHSRRARRHAYNNIINIISKKTFQNTKSIYTANKALHTPKKNEVHFFRRVLIHTVV